MEKMLIPINYDTEQPTVSARDLHNGLEINTRFNDWFSRMTDCLLYTSDAADE